MRHDRIDEYTAYERNPMANALTFDLVATLTGRDLPTDEVTVYPNEKALLGLTRVNAEITEFTEGEDTPKELVEKRDALKKEIADSALTFHLTGITRETTRDILTKVYEKYPEKRNAFGQVEVIPERDELFQTLLWAKQITKVVNADGAESPEVTEELVTIVRNNLPGFASVAVQNGIQKLAEDTAAGIDWIQADVDFLSQP